jgi:DNA-binding transcriptional ArsR family regulator
LPARTEAGGGVRSAPPERLFAALGDATRLGLVDRLVERGPQSIARLAAGSPISRQAVTKHLRVLERVGVVRSRRRGRERIWTLDPPQLDEARRHLDRIAAQWDVALERLRRFVEE